MRHKKKSVYIRIRKNNFSVIPSPQNVQKIYSPSPPLTSGQNRNPLLFEKSVKRHQTERDKNIQNHLFLLHQVIGFTFFIIDRICITNWMLSSSLCLIQESFTSPQNESGQMLKPAAHEFSKPCSNNEFTTRHLDWKNVKLDKCI